MKLIIDIDENTYRQAKEENDYEVIYNDYEIARAIINGTPVSNKGDLTSREALKKKFDDYIKANPNISGIFELGKIIIDTAPTVEVSGLPKIHYDRGFIAGYEKGKNERPQGKWINHRNDHGHNIADCSLCGKATQWHDEDEDGVPRYCWYCGADMRKPNCVTCDHFGKCEGCEKGEEE